MTYVKKSARKSVEVANEDSGSVVVGQPEVDPIDDKIKNRLEGKDYAPTETLQRFHLSTAFVRGVRGPVGGGKSTACCQEIMRRAREQTPDANGMRRTRWVIVRNTYGELKDTTVKTWLDWFNEEWFGRFNRMQGEMKHHIRIEDIDCEVLFRALDKPDDIKKVLSLELTGGWVNEAREMPKQIIDALGDRVGRYPAVRDGGATWSGLIMDTNSPDDSHWWHELSEEAKPEGWEFFTQPAGLIQIDGKWVENPEAENVANLPPHYYSTRTAGKKEDYIKVYYANQYGFVQEGKPVFPEYSDAVHGMKASMGLVPNEPVYVGIGFNATTYAALFGQKKKNGQWVWLDEVMPDMGGAITFAEMVSQKMAADFPPNVIWRVFAKRPKDSMDEDAETIQILKGRKIIAQPCRENDATLRREAVAGALSRLIMGEPAVQVSPRCKVARKAMSGGYCYAPIQARGEERYHDVPTQNKYAVMGEAAQYMLVGGGEAGNVFRSQKPKKLEYQELGII